MCACCVFVCVCVKSKNVRMCPLPGPPKSGLTDSRRLFAALIRKAGKFNGFPFFAQGKQDRMIQQQVVPMDFFRISRKKRRPSGGSSKDGKTQVFHSTFLTFWFYIL